MFSSAGLFVGCSRTRKLCICKCLFRCLRPLPPFSRITCTQYQLGSLGRSRDGSNLRPQSVCRSGTYWTSTGITGIRVVAESSRYGTSGCDSCQLAKLPQQYRPGEVPPLLQDFAEYIQPEEKSETTQSTILEKLQQVSDDKQQSLLITHVRKLAAKVLRLNSWQNLDADKPLIEMGLDSLMALELRNVLENSLACSLPATLLFDYPSLQTLVNHLIQDVMSLSKLEDSSPAPSLEESEPLISLEDLTRMSEAETELLLLKKLELIDGN